VLAGTPINSRRILLQQSFNACRLLLTATSAPGLGEDARVLLDGVTYTFSISINKEQENTEIYYYNVYSANKSNDSVKITQNKCRLLIVSHTRQHVLEDIIPFKFTRNIAKIRQSAILPRRMCNLVAPPGESQ